jgi:hypothetical protein
VVTTQTTKTSLNNANPIFVDLEIGKKKASKQATPRLRSHKSDSRSAAGVAQLAGDV